MGGKLFLGDVFMKIEYYSELLNKRFDSPQECKDAETEFKNAEKARKEKLAHKKDRLAELNEEYKKLKKLEDEFTKDYGSFTRYNSKYVEDSKDSFDRLFKALFS